MDLRTNLEYIMKHKMGLDDTFQFKCKGCGKCCTYRTDVILTSYDLFRVARYLRHTPAEIVNRHCEVYIDKDRHYPVVRINPVPPDNHCPFLRNKRCIVHQDKPLVCVVFPLARVTLPGELPFYTLSPDVKCGKSDRTISVRQWLGCYSNAESEEVSQLWNDCLLTITTAIYLSDPKTLSNHIDAVNNMLMSMIYLAYDISKPYIPQFKENSLFALATLNKSIGISDAPEWLPIHELKDKEAQYDMLLHKAYKIYEKQWCKQHSMSIMELEHQKIKRNLPCATLQEFMDTDFQNSDYIRASLSQEDFLVWSKLCGA